MNNNRTKIPQLCKMLQVLTQNSAISAVTAGNIATSYMRGITKPLEELINSRDIPVALLPVISEIKQNFL